MTLTMLLRDSNVKTIWEGTIEAQDRTDGRPLIVGREPASDFHTTDKKPVKTWLEEKRETLLFLTRGRSGMEGLAIPTVNRTTSISADGVLKTIRRKWYGLPRSADIRRARERLVASKIGCVRTHSGQTSPQAASTGYLCLQDGLKLKTKKDLDNLKHRALRLASPAYFKGKNDSSHPCADSV